MTLLTPMQLQHTDENRYDAETLRKVTALAERLQRENETTVTAREIEEIGQEIGLKPQFIREALTQVAHAPAPTGAVTQPQAARTPSRFPLVETLETMQLAHLEALMGSWWAAGWILFALPPVVCEALFRNSELGAAFSVLMLGVYIGFGIFVSSLYEARKKRENPSKKRRRRGRSEEEEETVVETAEVQSGGNQPLSRHEVLDAFFRLERVLQAERRHRCFLSIDVVGSTQMKHGAGELQIEYSFGEFQRWVAGLVAYCGGTVQSTAGDGMMAMFPDDESAVRAARMLQEGIGGFNLASNRLPHPFRVRCGMAAGDVALPTENAIGTLNSPILDRAAILQKQGEPGAVVVSQEVAAAALAGLGRLEALPGAPAGTAYVWSPGPSAN